jgi:hypothetical protein
MSKMKRIEATGLGGLVWSVEEARRYEFWMWLRGKGSYVQVLRPATVMYFPLAS